jgi:KDO2-lipid IV(A) lauroyltransferase
MRFLVETLLIQLIGVVFRILPRPAGLYLGKMIGRSGYYMASGRRRLALDNLRLALGGELSEGEMRETALGSFEYLGMNVAEFFKLPSLNRENIGQHTSLEGEENLVEALEMGKGILVLSSHLGNWDMLSAGLALRGYPAGLITKISGSEALNRIWMKYRRELGVELFMGRGTMKETIRHLRKGGMVGFALDQNARRKEGVFVDFFGHKACTITSLALLARRTGVPVLPISSYRDGRIHRIVIDEPMPHVNISDTDADILERTRIYTQWTEKVIRLHPDQWTWLHNRWKTRPRP